MLASLVLASSLSGTTMLAADHSSAGIHWLSDDWAKAKATALAAKTTVVVDVWATWCHTCISMKSFVLDQAPITALKDQHTWLLLDFDRPENASFFERFPITGVPTFLVIDPATDTVIARWVGSGTAEALASFFAHAKSGTDDLERRAQQAMAHGAYADARKHFAEALEHAQLKPERTRLIAGLIEAWWRIDKAACAREAQRYFAELENTATGLDTVALAGACASALPENEQRPTFVAIRDRLRSVAEDEALALEVDDRSNVWGSLIEAHEALGEHEDARKAREKRLALLERAAREAQTSAARATFDYHRMEAYLALSRFEDAIRMLKASAEAQPKDFNHPWRLAQVYLAEGKHAEGLAAIERALKLGYGGRKLRLFSTHLDLLLASGDRVGAARVLKAARKHLAQIPKAQVRQGWIDELEARARKLGRKGN